MRRLDLRTARQIRNRAHQLQDPMIRPRAQVHVLHRCSQQIPTNLIKLTELLYFRRSHVAIDQHIGFVLTANDLYVAVDLDTCIHNDIINEYAVSMIAQLGSYSEISPSGHGIRILLACADFHDNLRRPQLQLYSCARYVTITGHDIVGTHSGLRLSL